MIQKKILTEGINFGSFNGTTKKRKTKTESDSELETGINIKLDFDNHIYSLGGIKENISIEKGVDWSGDFNIYLSSGSDWYDSLETEDLYLNYGCNKQLKIKHKDDMLRFIRNLENFCGSYLGEYSILIEIIYNGSTKIFKLRRFEDC